MQPPTVHCPSHIYTLVVILNESVSCQQLFLQAESTMVANVTPDNLQDNVLLNFKIQVRNSLSETFEETHITNFCKFSFYLPWLMVTLMSLICRYY